MHNLFCLKPRISERKRSKTKSFVKVCSKIQAYVVVGERGGKVVRGGWVGMEGDRGGVATVAKLR